MEFWGPLQRGIGLGQQEDLEVHFISPGGWGLYSHFSGTTLQRGTHTWISFNQGTQALTHLKGIFDFPQFPILTQGFQGVISTSIIP